jgi:hypothetical protein
MKLTLLKDIYQNIVNYNKKKEIFYNGEDNLYPQRMDRFINNSVTAKTATSLMIQNLILNGFGDSLDKTIVNKFKRITLYNFADDLANSKVRQRGSFIWIGWNANYKISSVEVLPFHTCRLEKMDAEGHVAKIQYSRQWDESKQEDLVTFDIFNPDPNAIESQVKKAGGWNKYKGQVLYVNDDSDYIYPLSRIDAVSNDCDNEHQASVYKNQLLRKGFFGKTLIVTRPLTEKDLPKTIFRDGVEIRNKEYYDQESEREEFKNTIQDFIGAENAGGALHVELEWDHEKLDDAILIKNIDSNLDDKLFAHTESTTRKNILIAFNNLPNGLVEQSEGIFSNSGEAIKEMQNQYKNNCAKERSQFIDLLNDIWKRMEIYNGQPLILIDNATTEINNTGANTAV